MAITGIGRSVIKFTAQADALTGKRKVKHLRWVAADAVANETLNITDGDGLPLFESIADGANFIDIIPLYRWVDGIIVATMAHGFLYAYCD